MKYIEYLKLVIGLILISFQLYIGGVLFLVVSMSSSYFETGFYGMFIDVLLTNEHPTNALVFVGICGFTGAYLLASVKLKPKK